MQDGVPVQFDSAIRDHNLYPSVYECLAINGELELTAEAILARLARIKSREMANSNSNVVIPTQCDQIPILQSYNGLDTSVPMGGPPIIGQTFNNVNNAYDNNYPMEELGAQLTYPAENPSHAVLSTGLPNKASVPNSGQTNKLDSDDISILEIDSNYFKSLSLNGGIEPILNDPNFSGLVTVIVSE